MPPPPSPALVTAFAQAVRSLGVLFLKVAAEQSSSQATLTKQELLAVDVLGVRGPSRMGAIADHLGVGQSAVTPLVDRLEAAGLAERRRSDADRRVWRVDLTEAGRDVFAAESAAYERLAAEMLAPLEPAERETLVGLLGKMRPDG
ncbi:MAG: MarR family transcriptional regulator [Bacteroidota bacterium]